MSNADLAKLAVNELCRGNVFLADDTGTVGIYVRVPKFNLNDVISGASETPHPAFIVNGQEVDAIYVSKYQNIIQNGRAYSLPGQDPATGVPFDEARAACEQKGAGYHLMTNAEWAALALWCRKNGRMPKGNNDNGKDVGESEAVAFPTSTNAETGDTLRVATGSGPAEWSHNGEADGIWDMNGNVNEWVGGLRLYNGEIQVLAGNDAADSLNSQAADSAQWKAILEDGSLVAPGTADTLKLDYTTDHAEAAGTFAFQLAKALTHQQTTDNPTGSSAFEALAAASGVTVPELLKALCLMPADGGDHGGDYATIRNNGERMAMRGGNYENGATAGVFAFSAAQGRSAEGGSIGFRSVFIGDDEPALRIDSGNVLDHPDEAYDWILGKIAEAEAARNAAAEEAAEAREAAFEEAQEGREEAYNAAEAERANASATAVNSAATAAALATAAAALVTSNHYGVRWDKTNAQMVRTGDAAAITTTTTNFKHAGSVNANYSNPFDAIYPWSGRKLCNINIDRYYALAAGADLISCVKAWEGDPDFSYTDADGVWVYTPEFWGKSWDEGSYRYFDVTDRAIGGYARYRAGITGRWRGGVYTRTVGGTAKTVLLPRPGMPGKNVAVSALHTYAKNYNATLDNIFSIDATTLLYLVEFANFNTQDTIGKGVSELYKQSGYTIREAATASTVVKVLVANGSGYCVPGAIMDIGTSDGGTQVGSFIVSSAATDGTDPTLLDVTLTTDGTTPASVTVTTSNYWSIHGLANVADSSIGSKTGYIGTNGKCDVYYRGEVMAANMYLYVLGVCRETGTSHVWIAHNEAEADAYDALNATVHSDTEIVLPENMSGYINALGILDASGLLCAPPFGTAVGGSSSNPVGDYEYVPSLATGNTIMMLGGPANGGANDGRFDVTWTYTSAYSAWSFTARPRLKTP